MTKNWRFIDTGKCGAGLNMSIDEAIASSVLRDEHPPTLRIYAWERPSVTIGSFQKLSDISVHTCKKQSVPFVRRPTGGRAILHYEEITYSFVAGNRDHVGFSRMMDSYKLLSDTFVLAFKYAGVDAEVRDRHERGRVLSRSTHCFNAVSFGEILVNGHKIIGSAQKRFRNGFLQQGSIPFGIDKERCRAIFQNQNETVGLLELYPDITMKRMISLIKKAFESVFNMRLEPDELSPREKHRARYLLEHKYHSPEWTCRR